MYTDGKLLDLHLIGVDSNGIGFGKPEREGRTAGPSVRFGAAPYQAMPCVDSILRGP